MLRHRLAVAGFCTLLAISGLIIAQTAGPTPAPRAAVVKWVRTRAGWQIANWEQSGATHRPALHPALLAAFIALASVAALIAFSDGASSHLDPSEQTAS